MIDLPEDSIGAVKRILLEHVPDCTVWAFGSRVTGGAKPYSDLDLAVEGKEKLDTARRNRLEEAFEFSDLPMRVEILDWNSCPERIKKSIQSHREKIL